MVSAAIAVLCPTPCPCPQRTGRINGLSARSPASSLCHSADDPRLLGGWKGVQVSEPNDPRFGGSPGPQWPYEPPPQTQPPAYWGAQPQPQPWPVPPQPAGYPPQPGYFGVPMVPLPSAPRRSRAVRIVVIAVAVVAFVGLAAIAIAAIGSATAPTAGPARDLSIPSTFDSYDRLTSSLAQNVEDQMRIRMATSASAAARLYEKALIAVYAVPPTAAPQIVFIAVNAKDSQQARDLLGSGSPSGNADTFLLGAGVTRAASHPAGPLGGVLRCGQVSTAGGSYPACLWMDRSTFGLLIGVGGTSESALATATLDLRNSAEH